MLRTSKSSERAQSPRQQLSREVGRSCCSFTSVLFPPRGNSEEVNLHTADWYESTLLINTCDVHWARLRWENLHKPDGDIVMISKKCLNSILQDAIGNKKTEHADTSFPNTFPLCNRDVMTEMVPQLFITRFYYNAYGKGPWIKMA